MMMMTVLISNEAFADVFCSTARQGKDGPRCSLSVTRGMGEPGRRRRCRRALKKIDGVVEITRQGRQAVPALPLRFRRSPVSTIHTAASTDRMDGWHGRWGIFGARTRI